MAKDLEFQDYTAHTTDEDGDSHESTVTACVVSEELARVKNDQGNPVAREVMTPTGPRKVTAGDVLVKTEHEGVYDYLTADAWGSTGYAEDVAEDDSTTDDDA